MNKPFLFYFVERDGRVRQIKNGVVTSLSLKTPIENAPEGWIDILIKWLRNRDRHGQIREYSLPMGFVKDAAKILRNDAYKYNFDRELYLLIQRLTFEIDANNFSERYMFFYKGPIDFSTIEDDKGGYMVNANILEGGISKKVKAYENTQFFIPFDDDKVVIKNDGTIIEASFKGVIDNGISLDGDYYIGAHLTGIRLVQSEMFYSGGAKSVERTKDINHNILTAPMVDNWFFDATVTGQILIEYNIDLRVEFIQGNPGINPFADYVLAIVIVHKDGSITTPYELLRRGVATGGAALTIPGDYHLEQTAVAINIIEGDHLYLRQFCTVVGIDGDGMIRTIYNTTENTIFAGKYLYRHPTTYCDAFTPFIAYKKLCIKAGIEESKILSNALQNCTYCLTSGDAVRGLSGSGISTSLNDFYSAFDIFLFLGMSIKNIIEIEGRDKYYDKIDPIQLGSIKDFKANPAKDLFFSSIVFGHKEQDIQDVNGKYDFNGQLFYNGPMQVGEGKVLTMISSYKCGPYEIETLRRNTEGKTTTDTVKDNSVFILDAIVNLPNIINDVVSFVVGSPSFMIVPSNEVYNTGAIIKVTGTLNNGTYKVLGIGSIIFAQVVFIEPVAALPIVNEANVSVTIEFISGRIYDLDRSVVPDSGVPDTATVYNVRLRPAALLQLHYRWIKSILYNYEPGKLQFDHGNRNTDLVVAGIKDGRDINIADMGERIFIPWYFEFGTKVPINLTETLDQFPNKSFAGIEDIKGDFSGFLIEAGIAANTRQPQVFTLLCSPDVDITKFI